LLGLQSKGRPLNEFGQQRVKVDRARHGNVPRAVWMEGGGLADAVGRAANSALSAPSKFLYAAIEGGVELFTRAHAKETIISIVEPVAAFILAEAVKNAPNLLSARTLEPCRILMILPSDVHSAFNNDRSIARAVLSELATNYRELVKSLTCQRLRSGAERFANYLLTLSAAQGTKDRLSSTIKKNTLALLFGMTAESLTRTLAVLRDYGVRVDGSTIFHKRVRDLKRLARPISLIDNHEI
jgi:CRP/FNR family transcriptional regulator, transcriptional activator FtrB